MKNVYHPAMNMQKDENDKFKEINTIKETTFCYVLWVSIKCNNRVDL